MTRGLYIAGSGMLSRSRIINTIGNNIANSATAGFKKDEAVSGSFGEFLTYQIDPSGSSPVGTLTAGSTVDQVYTLQDQGALQESGRSTDLAIEGEGFFTLQGPDGARKLTRNGQFFLDENGFLTDASGNLVLGTEGPVKIGQPDFTVTDKGRIATDGLDLGKLLITCPVDVTLLQKEEGTVFTYNDPAWQTKEFQGNIRQGRLEGSNVDMLQEMSDMMQFSRSFQSCGQLVKMIDRIMEKSVNDIARI
jgi:flagellar basal-body rod protein FlgG